jgi:fibronectin type 3 domain-containing protein
MAYTIQFVYAVPGAYLPRQYYLQLTWTDSTDPNSASVNIYRSTVSGGPYTLIANVATGVQLYNDYAVTPEITYYYVVTEVNNVGAESAQSPQMSGTPGWIP